MQICNCVSLSEISVAKTFQIPGLRTERRKAEGGLSSGSDCAAGPCLERDLAAGNLAGCAHSCANTGPTPAEQEQLHWYGRTLKTTYCFSFINFFTCSVFQFFFLVIFIRCRCIYHSKYPNNSLWYKLIIAAGRWYGEELYTSLSP